MPATSSVAIQPVNWFTGSHPPQFINQDDRRPMIPFNRMAEWGANGRIVPEAPVHSPFIRRRRDLDLA